MLTAHNIKLKANNVQAGYLKRACGTGVDLGVKVVVADRCFPGSKRYSACGTVRIPCHCTSDFGRVLIEEHSMTVIGTLRSM